LFQGGEKEPPHLPYPLRKGRENDDNNRLQEKIKLEYVKTDE